jgi:hypothetical protein
MNSLLADIVRSILLLVNLQHLRNRLLLWTLSSPALADGPEDILQYSTLRRQFDIAIGP